MSASTKVSTYMKICKDDTMNEIMDSKTLLCCDDRVYCGNKRDIFVVLFLWTGYTFLACYFLAVVSPYYWVTYNPAVTIIGIVLAIPGLYNAIKCFSTGM